MYYLSSMVQMTLTSPITNENLYYSQSHSSDSRYVTSALGNPKVYTSREISVPPRAHCSLISPLASVRSGFTSQPPSPFSPYNSTLIIFAMKSCAVCHFAQKLSATTRKLGRSSGKGFPCSIQCFYEFPIAPLHRPVHRSLVIHVFQPNFHWLYLQNPLQHHEFLFYPSFLIITLKFCAPSNWYYFKSTNVTHDMAMLLSINDTQVPFLRIRP